MDQISKHKTFCLNCSAHINLAKTSPLLDTRVICDYFKLRKWMDWCGKLTWAQFAKFELQRLKFNTERLRDTAGNVIHGLKEENY